MDQCMDFSNFQHVMEQVKICSEVEEKEGNPTDWSVLKQASTEELVLLMRFFLTREYLINPTAILNICILVSGYNTLNDEMFKDKSIFFKDIEQLLDVKLALAPEIKQFQTEAVTWYLACLKSLHKVEYTYLDTAKDIPMVYQKFFACTNPVMLSQMMSKADSIDTAKLPLVKNAFPIIADLCSKMSLSSELLRKVFAENDKADL